MAGKGTSNKKQSSLAKLYLRSYNIVQTLGWCYIFYKFLSHNHSLPFVELWHSVQLPINIFQNSAILEIIHAATGLVPSNPFVTTVQVFSRIFVVCGILQATPETFAVSSIGLPMCLCTWSITEIIRYSYYFFGLIGYIPYPLLWLRYTLFIALYPLGITGELLCMYSAMAYAKANPQAWSYVLPNSCNFTFSYHYLIAIIMLSYLPLFPHLYMHMFNQRRKVLGKNDSQKKSH